MQHETDREPIDLVALQRDYRNTRFKEQIEAQLLTSDGSGHTDPLAELMTKIPASLQAQMGRWAERWMPRIEERNFFYRDGAVVFKEIIADAREFLRTVRYSGEVGDDLLYDLYQMVLINYAHFFEMDHQTAEAVGIRYTPPQPEQNGDGLRMTQMLAAVLACMLVWLVFQYR